jgi:hypothetical protein
MVGFGLGDAGQVKVAYAGVSVGGLAEVVASGGHGPVEVASGEVFHSHGGVVFFVVVGWA